MLSLALVAAAFASGAPADFAPEPAPLYVMMISHFDLPSVMSLSDIESFRQLSIDHPGMRWTHLYNPVAYTMDTPLLDEIEAYLVEARDVYGAEIGLHLHMYLSFLEATGIDLHYVRSFTAEPPDCPGGLYGYTACMTDYTRAEIRQMLQTSIELYADHGFDRPRTFCAGFYAASPELQAALVAEGFTVSAAGFPPGSVYGGWYGECWDILSGWADGTLTHWTTPYLVSTDTIMPDGKPPYLLTGEGPLIELPQVGKINNKISYYDMVDIYLEHYAIASAGRPTAVCLAIHEFDAFSYCPTYDNVLSFIEEHSEGGDVPVVFATASEIREAFLPILIPPGDVNGDGLIDVVDLLAVLGAWGPCHGCPEDLNHDDVVDVLDLLIVLGEWSSYGGSNEALPTDTPIEVEIHHGDTESRRFGIFSPSPCTIYQAADQACDRKNVR